MATQNKPAARPRVVPPFQGVNPPEGVGAPPPPPPRPTNDLTPTAEAMRRAAEIEREREMQEAMDRAAEISRRSSMGTLKEKPVKKAKGGTVSSASKRADGCAMRGKTKGRLV